MKRFLISLKAALLALGCAFAAVATPSVQAAEAAKAAPLTATFEKAKAAETGPQYVLTLRNDSKQDLKVSAKVQQSVVSHNSPKVHEVPAEVVAPGKAMTIRELAAHDKVTVTAEGFAPLELTVP